MRIYLISYTYVNFLYLRLSSWLLWELMVWLKGCNCLSKSGKTFIASFNKSLFSAHPSSLTAILTRLSCVVFMGLPRWCNFCKFSRLLLNNFILYIYSSVVFWMQISQLSLTFREIIYNYRKQPQCKPQVFRSVFVDWSSARRNGVWCLILNLIAIPS